MGRTKAGHPIITIHEGKAFMVTTPASEVSPDEEQGVFSDDTRLLSTYRLRINKQPWTPAASAGVSYFGGRYIFVSPKIKSSDGTLEPGKIELRLDRMVSGGGVHEDFDIVNHAQEELGFEFGITVESDFADIFEVKRHQIRQREIDSYWNKENSELAFHYTREDYERGVIFKINHADSIPHFANGTIHFGIKLGPAAQWRLCCSIIPVISSEKREPKSKCHSPAAGDKNEQGLQQNWHDNVARIDTPNESVKNTFGQSVYDIGALRLDVREGADYPPMPAAGVPWFVTIFGRDSLIVALQSMLIHPHLAKGTLDHLAKYQAKERNDWRDAQPGKILHEMRFGELAHFNETPHGPYYGTADASILYLIVLSEAFRWTGDKTLLADHRDTALKCLEWIDRYGDLDGDGFHEYKTFSSQGYHNMGWKDSGVAVLYPDGSQVQQPIAICELQGLVYDAKCRMSEVFETLGEDAKAKALKAEAEALKTKFNETFWMEGDGTYAYALDPDKKQVKTIASNPGQLLPVRDRRQRGEGSKCD